MTRVIMTWEGELKKEVRFERWASIFATWEGRHTLLQSTHERQPGPMCCWRHSLCLALALLALALLAPAVLSTPSIPAVPVQNAGGPEMQLYARGT